MQLFGALVPAQLLPGAGGQGGVPGLGEAADVEAGGGAQDLGQLRGGHGDAAAVHELQQQQHVLRPDILHSRDIHDGADSTDLFICTGLQGIHIFAVQK